MITFRLNGRDVEVEAGEASLLDILRERLGCRSVKDGCSPQGQCGCCTVLVDGAARVACVTPIRRVAGREVVTLEGLEPQLRARWLRAFVDAGASQCGFCTPGIVLRLVSLASRGRAPTTVDIRTALLAHLCRCTGWQSVVEAGCAALGVETPATGGSQRPDRLPSADRDPLLMAWRAELEGGTVQTVGADAVLGRAGFADDRAPRVAAVAVPDGTSGYVVGPDLVSARRRAGRVQGRNSTVSLTHPVALPEGEWVLTLRTTWVEPAYLEPDASWCEVGRAPASPLASGGAFGAKRRSPVAREAERLAQQLGQPVRVLWPREEVVRRGPKRPPVAMGLRSDASGVVRVGRSPGSVPLASLADRVSWVASDLSFEEVSIAGPPVAPDLRGTGWVEASVLKAGGRALGEGTTGPGTAVELAAPGGGEARVVVRTDGSVGVEVWAGEVLDEVVLRSYCIGAVHQALGWVWSEGVAVDAEGAVLDLTIRSFGILNALEMPEVDVTVHRGDRWPCNGSDAVFAAAAAAAWIADGLPDTWPTRR